MIYIFLGLVCLVVILGLVVLLRFGRKKRRGIGEDRKEYFFTLFKRIGAGIDFKGKIVDYDKLYHKILLEVGYEGSFGEILKGEPKEIGDLNKIWELHKLRNKLVHDFDLLGEVVLNRKSVEYKKEVEKLINIV